MWSWMTHSSYQSFYQFFNEWTNKYISISVFLNKDISYSDFILNSNSMLDSSIGTQLQIDLIKQTLAHNIPVTLKAPHYEKFHFTNVF